jgi:hypothetical protein
MQTLMWMDEEKGEGQSPLILTTEGPEGRAIKRYSHPFMPSGC